MDYTSPKIDKRSFQELLRQLRSMAPFYTPEWNALQEKDAGSGLVNIYLNMFEQMVQRLNNAPYKNFVAFLDMMGIKILPAQSAEAWVTFKLVDGAIENVLVPKGTEIAGTAPGGDEVIFQTKSNLMVSFAALLELYSVDGHNDEIYYHSSDFAAENPFTLFTGDNLQEHSLYLAHSDLLNQTRPSEIAVDFFLSSPAGDGVEFVWEYWNGNFWVSLSQFGGAAGIDETLAFRKSGEMLLKKNHSAEITSVEVFGIENRWIRCRLTNVLSAVAPIKLPTVNTIRLSIFHNDIPIDLQPLTLPLFGKEIAILMVRPEVTARPTPLDSRHLKFNEELSAGDLLEFDSKILDPLRRIVKSDSGTATIYTPTVVTFTQELADNSTFKIMQRSIDADKLLLFNIDKSFWDILIASINQTPLVNGDSPVSKEEDLEDFLVDLAQRIKSLINANLNLVNIIPGEETVQEVIDNLTIFIPDQVKLAVASELNLGKLLKNVALEVLGAINDRVNKTYADPSPSQLDFWNALKGILASRRNKLFVSWAAFFNELEVIATELAESFTEPPTWPPNPAAENSLKQLILEYAKYTDYEIKMLTALRVGNDEVRTSSLAGYSFYNGSKAYLRGGTFPEPVYLSIDDENSTTSTTGNGGGGGGPTGGGTLNPSIGNAAAAEETDETFGILHFIAGVENPYIEGHSINILPVIKPFGERPVIADTFFLASDEAFSKKGAKVELIIESEWKGLPPDSTPPSPIPTPDPLLSWEYWNGEGWRSLRVNDTTDRFRKDGSIKFTSPGDIAKVEVNGEEKYWIRSRIVNGDYGQEFIFQSVDGDPETDPIVNIIPGAIFYPVIKEILITYQSVKQEPEYCLTANNLNLEDRTKECNDDDFVFDPYVILPEEFSGIFLGFDKPLLLGPLRMLFDLEEQFLSDEEKVKVLWFYWNGSRWNQINVSDGTGNLTGIGSLEWVGSRDFARSKMFGKELFWIKGVVVEGSHPNPVEIKRILLNTVESFQASVITDEIAGSSDLTANQSFALLKKPIISQEVWVKEPRIPIEEEKQAILAEEGPDAILEVLDESGEVQEIWIRWHEVEDFDNSGSTDRHYTMNRRLGIIRFGDGENGLVPPTGADNIKATYRYGGGTIGNVPPLSINGLRNSIPFVDTVANFLQADGGSETETLDQTLERGSQRLKNRDRAVTIEDFERLARNAARKIARARCLPNTDNEGEPNPGWVTVIIVPESEDAKPEPSHQLLKIVSDRLAEQAANVLTTPDHIYVRGPEYLEIILEATVVPTSLEVAATVDSEVKEALNHFIHPLTGGADKTGWEFGKEICYSEVVSLVESLSGVDFVENLAFRVGSELIEGDVAIDEYTLPYSGEHVVNLILPVEQSGLSGSIKQSECIEE